MNILYRLVQVPVAETVATPAALALTVPPAADCARYDRLRDTPMEACDAAA